MMLLGSFELLSEFRLSVKFPHSTSQHSASAAREGEQSPLNEELETFGPNQALLLSGAAESHSPTEAGWS